MKGANALKFGCLFGASTSGHFGGQFSEVSPSDGLRQGYATVPRRGTRRLVQVVNG